ncbi:virion structural protein [Ralstonia phage PQ43W]
MGVVAFNPAVFAAEYPEFAAVPGSRTTAMFNLAQNTLLDNTSNSPVTDPAYLSELFNMLVAHLLLIFGAQVPTKATNQPPGRISSATEGTVSTSFEYNIPAGSAMAPWFNQTKYGAMFWMATARFRSARYFATGSSGSGSANAYGYPPVNVPGGI